MRTKKMEDVDEEGDAAEVEVEAVDADAEVAVEGDDVVSSLL